MTSVQYQSGDYIWAKTNSKYWAGIVLSASQIEKPAKQHKEWVYWFGDGRISEVSQSTMQKFHTFFGEHGNDPEFFYLMGKKQLAGMVEALQFYRLGVTKLTQAKNGPVSAKELLKWALQGFPGKLHDTKHNIPNKIFYKLQKTSIVINDSIFEESPIKQDFPVKLPPNLESFCFGCYTDEVYTSHPLFDAGLCFVCKERYLERFFMIGDDNIHYCCAICCNFGTLIVCSAARCGLSYCYECLDNLGSPDLRDYILASSRWNCFVCSRVEYSKTCRYIKCRPDWRIQLQAFFNTHKGFPIPRMLRYKKRLRVLSLFDGISTGLLALNQLNVDVETYFAAELDRNAKDVALKHHGERITYLETGDVRKINHRILAKIMPVHLVLGGSPCNDFSMANPLRKGIFAKNGSGVLFFEFYRIITALKRSHNGSFFWLYENVASMPEEAKTTISRFLECQPAEINSTCVSAQRRVRYFWGNCPSLQMNFDYDGEHSLQEYLGPGRIAAVDQIRTITTHFNSLLQGSEMHHAVFENNEFSQLTITEIENIFGLPNDYTQHKNFSYSIRLNLVGRAWSVQSICMLLHFLKYFFKLKSEHYFSLSDHNYSKN